MMEKKRIFEWIIVAATAGLLMLLKEIHLGITHFKYFVAVLLVWSLIVIVLFRAVSHGPKT